MLGPVVGLCKKKNEVAALISNMAGSSSDNGGRVAPTLERRISRYLINLCRIFTVVSYTAGYKRVIYANGSIGHFAALLVR